MSDLLKIDDHEGVRLLTLNRPEKRNAINNELWRAIRTAFQDAGEDPSIRCLVFTGAGGNFSAGVDLTSFMEPEEGEHPFLECARVIAGFDKPWIGAATGISVGGGATILFHADILYVGEGLRMRLPFAALALPPEFASSYMLQANIGAQRAAELFYSAEWIDAKKAVEYGIAARSYPNDDLLGAAMEKAEEIAQWPVNALREIKATLRLPHRQHIEAAFTAETEAMMRLAMSPENIEAVTAILEKRAPKFPDGR
jgi:enoyl-CoA hydratase/carnithine racemase